MTQITRHQHYVPAFYFKRFAKEEEEWRIQVFNVRVKRIEKSRHYGSMCHKEDQRAYLNRMLRLGIAGKMV